MHNWKAVLALATLVAGSAHAGVLGPTKPSQLVNVLASANTGTVCGYPAFDTQVAADGTRKPFDIPPGQVLVVTGFEWDSEVGSASQLAIATVISVTPDYATCDSAFSPSGGMTDSSGSASGSITFPTGIAVKSGTHLGLWMENGFLGRAKLYGYLATDR